MEIRSSTASVIDLPTIPVRSILIAFTTCLAGLFILLWAIVQVNQGEDPGKLMSVVFVGGLIFVPGVFYSYKIY